MRNAINVTEKREVTYSFGRSIEKKQTETYNLVQIDNVGQMTSCRFIKMLVDNGRLAWSYRAKASNLFTNEFLTKCVNDNLDLFEPQF